MQSGMQESLLTVGSCLRASPGKQERKKVSESAMPLFPASAQIPPSVTFHFTPRTQKTKASGSSEESLFDFF